MENESIRGRLLERSELVILMDSVSCHELSARSELVGSDCNQVATFWDSCGFRSHLCSTKNRSTLYNRTVIFVFIGVFWLTFLV